MSTAPARGELLPDRARLAKLVRMLAAPERENALRALDEALRGCGLGFDWLALLVEKGEVRDGPREAIFKRLVVSQLRRGLASAWSMPAGSPELVRLVMVGLEEGKPVEISQIERALEVAGDAQRRAR